MNEKEEEGEEGKEEEWEEKEEMEEEEDAGWLAGACCCCCCWRHPARLPTHACQLWSGAALPAHLLSLHSPTRRSRSH
ncbi:hypothetical protein E2C01_056155 [Portunus trituberculatus]|uniref:Uncharacterized protein n=1 Tax=Portunus trituberculatus TaxID=210409 RepID=A0A5B7GZL4_PORTR|nr:hypothetical protein [Portunus trituberculatus]